MVDGVDGCEGVCVGNRLRVGECVCVHASPGLEHAPSQLPQN